MINKYVCRLVDHFGRILTAAVVLHIVPSSASGQSGIPRTISHQGFLADATSGDPVPDASYGVTFRLYESSSGGSALWTETQSVSTTGGVFSVILGDAAGLDAISFTDSLWLSLQVAPDAEMTDRTKLTAVPYAIGLVLPFADTVASDKPLIQLNNSGTSDGILVTNTGSGTAGAFIQEDPTSDFSGVYGRTDGSGSAVFGQANGTGSAGRFVVDNVSSSAAAVRIETNGTGAAASVTGGPVEIELDGELSSPHLELKEQTAGEFARLRMHNFDNASYWDIAAGFTDNSRLIFSRQGTGTVMLLTNQGRVGIGVGTPTEVLHVDGVVRADSLYYNSPLQGYASLPGSAFKPQFQDGTIEFQGSSEFYYTGGSAIAASAPIQIPHNAVVQSISCHLFDSTPAENLTCELCLWNLAGCVVLGSVTSNDVSGGLDTYSGTLGSATVDNSASSFYLVVYTEGSSSWSTHSSALTIVGASIGYTMGGTP